jgi:hypothetical protein
MVDLLVESDEAHSHRDLKPVNRSQAVCMA